MNKTEAKLHMKFEDRNFSYIAQKVLGHEYILMTLLASLLAERKF